MSAQVTKPSSGDWNWVIEIDKDNANLSISPIQMCFTMAGLITHDITTLSKPEMAFDEMKHNLLSDFVKKDVYFYQSHYTRWTARDLFAMDSRDYHHWLKRYKEHRRRKESSFLFRKDRQGRWVMSDSPLVLDKRVQRGREEVYRLSVNEGSFEKGLLGKIQRWSGCSLGIPLQSTEGFDKRVQLSEKYVTMPWMKKSFKIVEEEGEGLVQKELNIRSEWMKNGPHHTFPEEHMNENQRKERLSILVDGVLAILTNPHERIRVRPTIVLPHTNLRLRSDHLRQATNDRKLTDAVVFSFLSALSRHTLSRLELVQWVEKERILFDS